jgi:peptidoglycan/xylan/chitin deacetylase (PgdA/CDA1 family)
MRSYFLDQLSRILPAFREPAVIILCFHRVTNEKHSWLRVYPDADGFEWRMRALQSLLPIYDLESALDNLRDGSLKKTVAAVSFDDGYKDNIDVAFPILNRLAIPATFFVSTGFLGSSGLTGERLRQAFATTSETQLKVPEVQESSLIWTDELSRSQVMTKVNRSLKYMHWLERERLTNEIVSALGSKDDASAMMTSEDLLKLEAAGMKIGSHSHMHAIGNVISDEEFTTDLQSSLSVLSSKLNNPISIFAFPNGKTQLDYGAKHLPLVKAVGFKYAITSNPGIVEPSFEAFAVPRFTPWDNTRVKFSLRLMMARQFGVH